MVKMVFAFLLGCSLAQLSVFAAVGVSTTTIDGRDLKEINRVSLQPNGRVMILWNGGGGQYAPDKLSREFLSSWGIGSEKVESVKHDELENAIRQGRFRIVEGVVYDLRHKQASWTYFPNARLMQRLNNGAALVDPSPDVNSIAVIHIQNLAQTISDTERFSFVARQVGTFEYINKAGNQRVIRSYDVGVPALRGQIPDAILKGGESSAPVASGGGQQRDALAELPQSEKILGNGTGFLISEEGHLITNDHVVRGVRRVKVRFNSEVLDAEIIKQDPVADLALLRISGRKFPALPLVLHKDAALGDEVFTIGFPNVDLQGTEPKYTDGRISSLAGMRDDPSRYQISVPVQPGNSGGALLDRNGQVVGVIVARISDYAVLRSSGTIPQNINYAVKSSGLREFLKSVRELDGKLKSAASETNSGAAIREAQSATVMVLGYR